MAVNESRLNDRRIMVIGRQVELATGLVSLLIVHLPSAVAKPIAFANGTTVMVKYGGNTMREAQMFYAPRFDLSTIPSATLSKATRATTS
jgi:hypothetical protein